MLESVFCTQISMALPERSAANCRTRCCVLVLETTAVFVPHAVFDVFFTTSAYNVPPGAARAVHTAWPRPAESSTVPSAGPVALLIERTPLQVPLAAAKFAYRVVPCSQMTT